MLGRGAGAGVTHPRVLAIVLNWRQPEMTLACVQALQAMACPGLDILVVDNGSGATSTAVLEAQDGWRLLALPQNLGFAGGNNRGLELALAEGYDHALIVNNDAFAAPDMLQQLLVEAAPDIALLTPKILYESDPARIWFAGGRCAPRTLDLRGTGQGAPDGLRFAASRDVDYLVGTCWLVNLTAVVQVGLLDETFFMYFEDLDWSLRFRQAGYRLRLVAPARLFHRVAMSTGGTDDTPLRRYYLAYSSVVFWRRYSQMGNPAVIAAFRLASAGKMVTRLALTGRGSVARAYLRGLRDGWRASQADAARRGAASAV